MRIQALAEPAQDHLPRIVDGLDRQLLLAAREVEVERAARRARLFQHLEKPGAVKTLALEERGRGLHDPAPGLSALSHGTI